MVLMCYSGYLYGEVATDKELHVYSTTVGVGARGEKRSNTCDCQHLEGTTISVSTMQKDLVRVRVYNNGKDGTLTPRDERVEVVC